MDIPERIHQFSQQFNSEQFPFKFISNGIFGYIAHEAVDRFENIDLNKTKPGYNIPDIYYAVYQNIIAISLFNHEAHLFSHVYEGEHNLGENRNVTQCKNSSHFSFEKVGDKSSNLTDEQFIDFVKKGKNTVLEGTFSNWYFRVAFLKDLKATSLMFIAPCVRLTLLLFVFL